MSFLAQCTCVDTSSVFLLLRNPTIKQISLKKLVAEMLCRSRGNDR